MQNSKTTDNAVKLLGEALVPGASLMMDGKILSGGLHTIVGVWAKMALGPAGLAVVLANSYAQSTTGKGLLKQFKSDAPKGEAPKAEAPKAEAPKAEAAKN
ncbi:DUF6072 family protein [Nannocystis punicea]|uniref:Uncharacterized protein n=1 Tax=Nannocystis punicea TaxID=2995304 RepID=A0ABY7HBI7_9BACT|nr:DUF6072 family protein [Nannocystis poenicansa]WAS96622.1 hypothetical protein O0S08_10740 [Nannocystis poenicansa]